MTEVYLIVFLALVLGFTAGHSNEKGETENTVLISCGAIKEVKIRDHTISCSVGK